ncbi:MAG: hypothetical protein EBT15_12085, partial [Betaproteobacteria bacterium]|nr:hypothetical protein [Betaproteobacteria bacterium]
MNTMMLVSMSKLSMACARLGITVVGPNAKADAVAALALSGISDEAALLKFLADSDPTAAPLVPPASITPTADPALIRDEIAKAVAALIGPIEDAIKAKPEIVRSMIAPCVSKPVTEVFGIDLRDAAGRTLRVDVYSDPEAPKIDPNYVWQENVLHHLIV